MLLGWLAANAALGLPTESGKGAPLPRPLPFARVSGLAEVGSQYLIGGLGGLFISNHHGWKRVTTAPVRQVVGQGSVVWVLYGSGAVDKFEPLLGRRYPDIFQGPTHRPWSSYLSVNGFQLFAGGFGGWIEHGIATKERYPDELKGQVVTAMMVDETTLWVGTQKGGLLRFEGQKVRRWTPAHGLNDPWITALTKTPDGLLVGTYSEGLFRIDSADQVISVAAPNQRIRHLLNLKGRIFVGTASGAFQKDRTKWKSVSSAEEITGLVVVNGHLAVLSISGVNLR